MNRGTEEQGTDEQMNDEVKKKQSTKNISPTCAAKEGCPSGLAMGGVVLALEKF